MFYLYATFIDKEPIAKFDTEDVAIVMGRHWFVGSNWIVRDTPTFDFFKA